MAPGNKVLDYLGCTNYIITRAVTQQVVDTPGNILCNFNAARVSFPQEINLERSQNVNWFNSEIMAKFKDPGRNNLALGFEIVL